MIRIFCLIFLYSLSGFSADNIIEKFENEQWNFYGKPKLLYRNNSEALILSSNCFKDNKLNRCDALSAIKKATLKDIQINLGYGARPGIHVCLKLNGVVLPAFDKNKNQNTFCMFKDQSLIANGSLTHYAYKNDGIR